MKDLPTAAALKQRAYDLKKATGMQIGHCYEALAQQYGFKTYAAMRSYIKGVWNERPTHRDAR